MILTLLPILDQADKTPKYVHVLACSLCIHCVYVCVYTVCVCVCVCVFEWERLCQCVCVFMCVALCMYLCAYMQLRDSVCVWEMGGGVGVLCTETRTVHKIFAQFLKVQPNNLVSSQYKTICWFFLVISSRLKSRESEGKKCMFLSK